MRSAPRFVLGAFLLALGASAPASAQIQLSGVWNPRTHEDQLDRGPGPDLGDYTGLPINDAARSVRRELGRLAPHAAGTPVPRARGALHLPRPAAPADLGGEGSRNAADHRDQAIHQHLRADADDLDGRPSAPVGVRAAHVHGIFNRRVGGRHADGDDHASEAGLAPPQRRPRKRSDDPGRALHHGTASTSRTSRSSPIRSIWPSR